MLTNWEATGENNLAVADGNAIFLRLRDGRVVFYAHVISRFEVTGRVASTDAFNRAETTGEPARLGPIPTGHRRNELMLDQVNVTWPG